MIPLKISSFLERPPLPQSPLAPMRARLAATESPQLPPAPAGPPEVDRRATSRRVLERRESEAPAFLDTRVSQGRRRNPGRRVEDRQQSGQRIAISVKA